jgi:hypothetical protein
MREFSRPSSPTSSNAVNTIEIKETSREDTIDNRTSKIGNKISAKAIAIVRMSVSSSKISTNTSININNSKTKRNWSREKYARERK